MANEAEDAVKLAERNATELAEQKKITDKALADKAALENKVLDGTIKAFFEEHKEVIIPAMHDRIKALVKSFKADSVVKLGEKEENAQESLLTLLGEIAKAKGVELKETKDEEEDEDDEEEKKKKAKKPFADSGLPVMGADLAVAAQKYSEEHNVSYGVALRKVATKEAI